MSGILTDVLHQYKLVHVIIHWGRVTLNLVLKWSLEYQKRDEADLYDIVIENECKKSFHRDQIKMLKEGVAIDSLDITIAFLLLLHIGGLSKYNDPAWQNSPSLEYNLKMVKFHRNSSCHISDSMSEKDTLEKINELRKLYEDILSASGKKFLIEEGIIKNKIDEITNGVDSIHEKIRETFDPNNKQDVHNFRKELKILKEEINKEIIQEAQAKLQEVNSNSCLLQILPWIPHNYSTKPSKLYVPNEYHLNEKSRTVQGTILNDILDIKSNNENAQQFWVVCGERGSGKTMLCKYLIEKSINLNPSSRQTKFFFILHSQEVDYRYDSLDAMIRNIFHEIYTNNGLSIGYFMEILTSVPVLVVIDGYTESHIKLVRDTVTRSNVSAVITVRPGSQGEIKKLLNHNANITDVNIQMLNNENVKKIVSNVLTVLGDPKEFNELTKKINEETESLGTWLKYPLGILIMTVLWFHKEIDATTNTSFIQTIIFNNMVKRFKDGVYKYNFCSTMDEANEKCKDIIEKCKDIYENSDGVELRTQELEILHELCKANSLREEYTLSSFFDSKIEIQRFEACKIRTLPCHLPPNAENITDSTSGYLTVNHTGFSRTSNFNIPINFPGNVKVNANRITMNRFRREGFNMLKKCINIEVENMPKK